MTQYQVTTAVSLLHLEGVVNKLIDEGWRCTGGIFAFKEGTYNIIYMQAMTLK